MSAHTFSTHDEPGRLRALKRYTVLDTPPEDAFERIARITRVALDVPITAVTLIDESRQWYKSIAGLNATEMPRELAFCNHTIRETGPVIVEDARLDARFSANPMVTGEPGVRSYLATQLMSPDGYPVGTICAVDLKPRRFEAVHALAISDLARVTVDELELRLIAQTDDLTGALTRRGILNELDREMERSARYLEPLSVLSLDIDCFRDLNDQHGHECGDAILKSIGAALKAALRPTDLFGRMGGEEFLALLPHTDLAAAKLAADRFRAVVERALTDWKGQKLAATISVGAVEFDSCRDTPASILERADAALGIAKSEGRNRTQTYWTDEQLALHAARAPEALCAIGRSALR